MQIVYSEVHQRHATTDRMPGCGFVYREVPGRAERIIAALSENRVGEITGPQDYGLAPILAVQDPAFVDYLRTAYTASRNAFPGADPVVTDTFAARGWRYRPSGFPGCIGYYAFDNACPILEGTWDAAYASAQCALTAAELVQNGERAVYALCRPPGHHASSDEHGGYCYLNNAAIAARALQRATEERIAIFDFDYHHGNGTQEIFYFDAGVLFCSLHAHPDFDYPFFWGGATERGEGPGAGYNRNWPLPLGCDDSEYLAALSEALTVIREYAPAFLVISAGFDLMQGDPEALGGGFRFTRDGLRVMAERLAGLQLPTVIVQEGGYDLNRIGEYATLFLQPFTSAG